MTGTGKFEQMNGTILMVDENISAPAYLIENIALIAKTWWPAGYGIWCGGMSGRVGVGGFPTFFVALYATFFLLVYKIGNMVDNAPLQYRTIIRVRNRKSWSRLNFLFDN